MKESVAHSQAVKLPDMDYLILFSLLLTNLAVTESNGKENCLSQPAKEIEKIMGQSAVLECTVSADCLERGMHFEWFVFKENIHDNHINLNSEPLKFSLVGGSLHIQSLNVSDSGIYHCAAVWPGEPTRGRQYVGPGATLIVKGHVKLRVKYILLWLSFILLAIYSLAIVSLIISKKFGCKLFIGRGLDKTDKKNSTKKATKRRTQFRDVLEEMYSKKNLARQKQTAGGNKVDAANADFSSSIDDIYQNV